MIVTRTWRHAYVRRLVAWGVDVREAITLFWIAYCFDSDAHPKGDPVEEADKAMSAILGPIKKRRWN